MASAMISRDNYSSKYTYFIPMSGKDWGVESMGEDFSLRLTSAIDSAETLQAFLDNHAALTVLADKTTITANGSDSVTWTIQGQTVFSYVILKNNLAIASGNIVDGALVFSTDVKDIYLVQLTLGQQTGFAMVEAV